MDSTPYPAATAHPGSSFIPAFAPVPLRERHDGWTPARQAEFIAALAASGCVTAACAHVGMSTESAYRLRARHDATDFRGAWALVLDFAVDRLEHAVLSRAIEGVAVPHFYQGEIVGESRRYDERLAMFLLRHRRRETYGRAAESQPLPQQHPERRAENVAISLIAVGRDCSRSRYEREALGRREEMAAALEEQARSYAARPDADPDELAHRLDRAEAAAAERDEYAARLQAEAIAREAANPSGRPPVGAEIPAYVPRPSSTSADRAAGAPARGAAKSGAAPVSPPGAAAAGNRLSRRAAQAAAKRRTARRKTGPGAP